MKMNRKFLLSVAVMSITSLLLGFVVHGVLLHAEYAKLSNLMRSEQDAMNYFPFMLLAHLLIGIGITWIYLKGREDKPWLAQGFRFGVAVAVLVPIPMYLIYFAVQPMPSDLVAQQIVFDSVATIIMGVLVAWLNR
jgi:drug/metabolite transporter (DMT)-like permease